MRGRQDFLAILADPSHAEHASVLECVGGAVDPKDFDYRTAFGRFFYMQL